MSGALQIGISVLAAVCTVGLFIVTNRWWLIALRLGVVLPLLVHLGPDGNTMFDLVYLYVCYALLLGSVIKQSRDKRAKAGVPTKT